MFSQASLTTFDAMFRNNPEVWLDSYVTRVSATDR